MNSDPVRKLAESDLAEVSQLLESTINKGKVMLKKLIVAVGLSAFAMAAMAGEGYLGIGTTGYGVGFAYKLSDNAGLRAEYNGLDYSHQVNSNGATYDAKIKMSNLGAYYDYFISGGFRATAGLVAGDNKFTGSANASSGTYTINGTAYSAAGESLTFQAKMPDVMPYFGIGYGHDQVKPGLGFYADAGFMYGKPKAELSASAGLTAAAGQSNIDAEKQKLQDQLNKYSLFPVVKVGLSYAF